MQNYKIMKNINKGAFAQVYEAIDNVSGRTLAVKVQKMDPMFYNEVKIMKKMKKYKIQGFPFLDSFGSIDEELGFIAMELLGPNSLEMLRKIEQRKNKEKTYGLPLVAVAAIAVKLIFSLKRLHSIGYLHSDVKPNNVVFDLYEDIDDLYCVDSKGKASFNDRSRIFLVDFGLSEKYTNQDGTHASSGKINRQLGNKFFMSLSQLKKNISSRRDDLEQLIYTLVFLAKGDLPWSLKKNYSTQDVIKAKSCQSVLNMMFEDLPFQFRQAFDYIKNLEFNQKPDYFWLANLFQSILNLQDRSIFKSCTKRPQIVTPKEIEDIQEQEQKKHISYEDQMQALFQGSTRVSLISPQSRSFQTKLRPEQGTQVNPYNAQKCCQTSDELRSGIQYQQEEKKISQELTMSGCEYMQIDSQTLKLEEDMMEEESQPTIMLKSIYKREAKPMDLNFLPGPSII